MFERHNIWCETREDATESIKHLEKHIERPEIEGDRPLLTVENLRQPSKFHLKASKTKESDKDTVDEETVGLPDSDESDGEIVPVFQTQVIGCRKDSKRKADLIDDKLVMKISPQCIPWLGTFIKRMKFLHRVF